MKTKNPFAKVLFTTVIVIFLSAMSPQDAFANHGWRTLVGSWVVDVTPNGLPPFTNIATINWPATIINWDPVFGAGHGTWKRTGRRAFESKFLHLVTPEAAANLPVPGVTSLTVRGFLTVRGNGDKADGAFITDFLDSNGEPLFSFDGVVEFTRIKVDD